jgi:hypothetical protein
MSELKTSKQIREERRRKDQQIVEVPGVGYFSQDVYQRALRRDPNEPRPTRVPFVKLSGK